MTPYISYLTSTSQHHSAVSHNISSPSPLCRFSVTPHIDSDPSFTRRRRVFVVPAADPERKKHFAEAATAAAQDIPASIRAELKIATAGRNQRLAEVATAAAKGELASDRAELKLMRARYALQQMHPTPAKTTVEMREETGDARRIRRQPRMASGLRGGAYTGSPGAPGIGEGQPPPAGREAGRRPPRSAT